MPEADVQLIGVTKRFGSVTAVNSIDLEVYRGEFLSVIGPSGCGKTTTMRLVAGLDQPDAGQILIRGAPNGRRAAVSTQRRPRLSIVCPVPAPQCAGERRLRPAHAQGAAERRREKSLKALRAVGMESLAQRSIEQLSGGQKQRVALARALVVEPALILLDEPLGSLDAKLRIEMQSELKSLQRQMGITFIHVSHNQGEALVMADRIAVMNEGRFEQISLPQTIYRQPQTRFVAEFVGRNNLFEGEIVEARRRHRARRNSSWRLRGGSGRRSKGRAESHFRGAGGPHASGAGRKRQWGGEHDHRA